MILKDYCVGTPTIRVYHEYDRLERVEINKTYDQAPKTRMHRAYDMSKRNSCELNSMLCLKPSAYGVGCVEPTT